MKKLMMLIWLFISLTVSAQLPNVQSGSIEPCFVLIMNSYVTTIDSTWGNINHPLKQGDSIFAYCEIDSKNTLLGKGFWAHNEKTIADTGCVLAVMLNDKGVTAPNQITGIEYGEKFKIGVVKDGFLIELIPLRVLNSQWQKSVLKAYSLELYTIFGLTLGDTIDEINEVPYLSWLHAQKPVPGDSVIFITKTFDLNKKDNRFAYINVKPKYLYNVNYSLINSTSVIEKWNWEIALSKDDFDKGFLDLKISGTDYYSNPYVFNHLIKFVNCKWIPAIQTAKVPYKPPPKVEPPVEFYTPEIFSNTVISNKYVTICVSSSVTVVKNKQGNDVEITDQIYTFKNNTNKNITISYKKPNKANGGFMITPGQQRTEKIFNSGELKKYAGKELIIKYSIQSVVNFEVKFNDDKGEFSILIK